MTSTRTSVWRTVAGSVAGLATLAACGGDPGTTPAGPEGTPTQTGREIVVEMTDFALDVAEPNLTPGTYTLVAEQQGAVVHALSISGPGIESESTEVVDPGGDPAKLTVTLEPGSYELWCPVGGHRAQGMEARLTVG